VARKGKRRQGRAQLKVRLPEALRREIEAAAAQRGHSMNTEIVERLLLSDRTRDAKKLAARALLDNLDDEVIGHIVAERMPARYREFAAQCYHLASVTKAEDQRKEFQELARAWAELAKKAESPTEERKSILATMAGQK
jgi:hypothetical protein